MDAKLLGGLLDLAALAHESDGAGTKLRWVRAWHAVSLPWRPSTSDVNWKLSHGSGQDVTYPFSRRERSARAHLA